MKFFSASSACARSCLSGLYVFTSISCKIASILTLVLLQSKETLCMKIPWKNTMKWRWSLCECGPSTGRTTMDEARCVLAFKINIMWCGYYWWRIKISQILGPQSTVPDKTQDETKLYSTHTHFEKRQKGRFKEKKRRTVYSFPNFRS